MMEKTVKRMKGIREQEGISLRELAQELDVNYSLISYWEHGVRNPSRRNEIKLEKFFDKPITFLLDTDPSYNKKETKIS